MSEKPIVISTSLLIIFMMILAAIFAPLLTSFDPGLMDLKSRLLTPSHLHFFGTDENGVDIFSQVLFGARVSLLISFAVIFNSLLIGLFIGSLAGYLGGWWDHFLMRFVDIIYAFPGFLLILTMAAVMQSSTIGNLILVLSLTGWASYARLIRGEILYLKDKDYVLGAESLGASHWRKLIFYIWPNLIGPVTVQASFGMSAVIITESSLSFLGIGLSPTIPTWGRLLNSGRNYLIEAPHLSLFPGIAILLIVLSFNLLGDGLRELLDSKN